MFIRVIFGYIIGYLRLEIEGYYIERFINICTNMKITIWNLKKDKDVMLNANIRISDFRKVCKVAKKTKCKVRIIKRRGIPFIWNKYKKRKVFIIFLLMLILLISISSNFIWNVEIKEENGEQIDGIKKDIEEVGLYSGNLKSKVNTKNVINQIRLKRKDIAWMGIEIKGTNAIVKLVKAGEKPEIINEEEYCSITSNKAGVITKINAQAGTANVSIGDTVNVGETLINGWIEGKYTGIRYVHAKGEIEAKVWHTKSKIIEYNTTERKKTGNIENKFSIKFNNFKINLYKRLSNFEIYDTIETEDKMKIFSNFYLPISIVKNVNEQVEEIEKIYSKEEAKTIGIERLEAELDQEIENKEKVVNKNVNTYESENSVEVYVTYEVIENIGTNEKIVF